MGKTTQKGASSLKKPQGIGEEASQAAATDAKAALPSINVDIYPPPVRDYLATLNPDQLAVAAASTGPYVVAGGPGSGKTRAVIARLARLTCDGLDPGLVLAMTFTKAAAGEMTNRLRALGISGARVGTIHSVCLEILNSEASNLTSIYSLDTSNRITYALRKGLGELLRKRKVGRVGVDREGVERFVGSCKASGICFVAGDPFGSNIAASDHIMLEAQRWRHKAGIAPSILFEFYHDMERRRDLIQKYDFDDMLLWAWMCLVTDPSTLDRWQRRWSLVIVDEAQDSNPIQWDLARLLVGYPSCIPSVKELSSPPKQADRDPTLMVAGDASQSLYSFRAAEPDLFVAFAKEAATTMLTLPVNYRSTPEICHAGTKLVENYDFHLVGKLIAADSTPAPQSIDIVRYNTPDQEVDDAIERARAIAADGGGLRKSVILSRMSQALHLAELHCIRKRIKYIKAAAGSFLESTEVKTVVSYLRVAGGYDLDGQALRYIINRPYRAISNQTITEAQILAREMNISLIDALLNNRVQLSYRQKSKARDLMLLLLDMNKLARRAEELLQNDDTNVRISAPAEMIAMMLKRTGYIEELRREQGLTRQDDSKEALLAELTRMGEMFLTIDKFLGYIDALAVAVKKARRNGLRVGEGSDEDALVLSTIHRSKGLEWEHVNVVDVRRGVLPHARSDSYEEELRLFYVALTRAEKTCTVSYAGEPSSFVGELAKITGKEARDG